MIFGCIASDLNSMTEVYFINMISYYNPNYPKRFALINPSRRANVM